MFFVVIYMKNSPHESTFYINLSYSFRKEYGMKMSQGKMGK